MVAIPYDNHYKVKFPHHDAFVAINAGKMSSRRALAMVTPAIDDVVASAAQDPARIIAYAESRLYYHLDDPHSVVALSNASRTCL